jgi:hypothetical protein
MAAIARILSRRLPVTHSSVETLKTWSYLPEQAWWCHCFWPRAAWISASDFYDPHHHPAGFCSRSREVVSFIRGSRKFLERTRWGESGALRRFSALEPDRPQTAPPESIARPGFSAVCVTVFRKTRHRLERGPPIARAAQSSLPSPPVRAWM